MSSGVVEARVGQLEGDEGEIENRRQVGLYIELRFAALDRQFLDFIYLYARLRIEYALPIYLIGTFLAVAWIRIRGRRSAETI